MKRIVVWMTAGAAALAFAGCARIQTRVVEKPRVDQELTGNRGYLKGSPSSEGARSKTREVLETNIELPTMEEMNPWRTHHKTPAPAASARTAEAPVQPAPSENWQTPQEEQVPPVAESPAPESVSAPAVGTTYIVQKGDTLEKIAKKFYGSTKKWYRIFKANKETLKSPDRIRPGMKLVIPPKQAQTEETHHHFRHHEEYK